MLRGIAFLHSRDVTHGDIQSDNLLFSAFRLDSVRIEELEDDKNNAIEILKRLDEKTDK
jgi:serine/threonine protein kinase